MLNFFLVHVAAIEEVENCYECIVRSIPEYASQVRYLHSSGDIKQLKSVQRRTARWVCGSQCNPFNKHWSKSSDHCISHLKWPILHQRQNCFNICQVHNILNHKTAIPSSQYFSAVNRHPTNSSALDTSISSIGLYRYSIFINSAFLWNNIPTKILQIINVKLFQSALRHLLF